MIGIQRKKVSDWITNNIDLTITLSGITIVLAVKQVSDYHIVLENPSLNIEFWGLFFGVVMSSIGIASLVCYRVLFKWNKF